MKDRPHILVLDERYARVWRRVLPEAHWHLVGESDEDWSLEPGQPLPAPPRRLLEVAGEHANRYDLVLGELSGAFLWHALFRLVGDQTPFLIVPRYNHVLAPHAYALLLSSQLGIGRELISAGSTAACRSFAGCGLDADPLFLPGIDFSRFQRLGESPQELKRHLGLPSDRDLVLFTGRMEADKNVLELLDVLERVQRYRPVQLALCFHFRNDAYLERVRQLARNRRWIHLVDRPDADDLIRYYNAADLFVSAAVSLFETFGRSPIEALGCGTPSVVPAYDGFRDTVPPSVGRTVPTVRTGSRLVPDVEGLAQAVVTELEDRDRLIEHARAGARHAELYSEPHTMERLGRRLDALVRSTPSRNPVRRIVLDGYPPAMQELWRPLEGRPVEDLLLGFLESWRVPVQPPPELIREVYWSWFNHY